MSSESEKEPDGRHRVVVIGGGMAGARLAQQLAAVSEAADATAAGGAAPAGGTTAAAAPVVTVTVIGEEPHAPYNRVLLAEVLAGRYAPEVVALPAPAAHHLRGVRAVRIDRGPRTVHCDDGRRVPYDTLVLATGSNPVLPPLRGLFEADSHELPEGVHAFRTMDDCLTLAAAVREPGVRVVVIGGGLLGVSAARALAQRGAQVVLAHQGEHLMERQVDAHAAGVLRAHLEALGVEVHTECRVRGLRTEAARGADASSTPTSRRPAGGADRGPRAPRGRRAPVPRAVRAVVLADGFTLDTDLVVFACGVRPRVGLARAAGLDVARGVVVDDELRTSDPSIHAIGDCAEHDGVVYGLAGPAQEQADVLARAIAARLRDPDQPRDHDRVRDADQPRDADHRHHAGDQDGHQATHQPGHHGSGGDAPHRYRGTRALTRLTLAAPPAAAARPATDDPATGSPAAAHPTTAVPQADAPAAAPAATAAVCGPLDLATFGEAVPAPGDDVVQLSDATRGAYRKVVVRQDRLVGGILLGDLGTVGALARAWEGDAPLPAAPLLHLLTNDGGS
ncbi:NAD(P)/FAD-dependent oxidoreductase [Streptomyces sp. XD-27]|uniref:NAD(P)/FAD-dependent oxidoreductase n=1 Tax=Streptomyces sp. XD-27 TaxID=3062779 RepID=UPI0026F4691A|nr:FAD-dependent oxidoreductase [Streptomyces sp. XD-27]WKX70215.1 FAD-dependent oxidoreductase [Streptomyces sp. XD-27]